MLSMSDGMAEYNFATGPLRRQHLSSPLESRRLQSRVSSISPALYVGRMAAKTQPPRVAQLNASPRGLLHFGAATAP